MRAFCRHFDEGLDGLAGIIASRIDTTFEGRPGPYVELVLDNTAALSATELVNLLQAEDPMVCTWEGRAFQGVVALYPEALADGEAEEIVDVIEKIVTHHINKQQQIRSS